MNRKNLVVSGCSFTKGHILQEKGSWATYLNEMMGTTLHNRAGGGMGNSYISTSIIGYLTQNQELIEDSIVIVAWSEITRMLGTFMHQPPRGNEIVTIRPQDFIDDDKKIGWSDAGFDSYHRYVVEHREVLMPFFSTWNYAVYETYVAMLNLKTFLELHKIPYLFFDAIADSKVVINDSKLLLRSTWIDIELDEVIDPMDHMSCILNEEVIDKIFNDDRWISFYGKSMCIDMQSDQLKYEKYTQGNGGHPNEYASNHYAKLILNEYERLYNK